MNCPKCNGDNVGNITEDIISCCECKAKLVIDYWICADCNMTFRMMNGGYLDSFRIDHEDIEMSARELGTAVQELSKINNESLEDSLSNECDEAMSMSDLVHSCVKCGEFFIESVRVKEFKCPHCGFEWEVLR